MRMATRDDAQALATVVGDALYDDPRTFGRSPIRFVAERSCPVLPIVRRRVDRSRHGLHRRGSLRGLSLISPGCDER